VIPISPAAFLPLQIMPSEEINVKMVPCTLRTIILEISHAAASVSLHR
jgi:hypothetical protein